MEYDLVDEIEQLPTEKQKAIKNEILKELEAKLKSLTKEKHDLLKQIEITSQKAAMMQLTVPQKSEVSQPLKTLFNNVVIGPYEDAHADAIDSYQKRSKDLDDEINVFEISIKKLKAKTGYHYKGK